MLKEQMEQLVGLVDALLTMYVREEADGTIDIQDLRKLQKTVEIYNLSKAIALEQAEMMDKMNKRMDKLERMTSEILDSTENLTVMVKKTLPKD